MLLPGQPALKPENTDTNAASGHLLVIRADGGKSIGVGHLMRCLSTCKQWILSGGSALLATAEAPDSVIDCYLAAGAKLLQLPKASDYGTELALILRAVGAFYGRKTDVAVECAGLWQQKSKNRHTWFLLDNYDLRREYAGWLYSHGFFVAAFDDWNRLRGWPLHLLVNYQADAIRLDYAPRPYCVLALGPKFVPLDDSFSVTRHEARTVDHPRRLLVTAGGSSGDALRFVVTSLRFVRRPFLAAVLVGPEVEPYACVEPDSIASEENLPEGFKEDFVALQSCVDKTVQVAHVGHGWIAFVRQMGRTAQLFRWAQLAISAAGFSAWELAACETPSVIFTVADNQDRVATALTKATGFLLVGSLRSLDHEKLARAIEQLASCPHKQREIIEQCEAVVDRRGARRIVSLMQAICCRPGRDRLQVRSATEQDCRWLWWLANNRLVRKQSLSTHPIDWETHEAWFKQRLQDPDCRMYLACLDDLPVGFVRYNRRQGHTAVISIGVHPAFWRCGIARLLTEKTMPAACAQLGANSIEAVVRLGNDRSRQLFERLGFQLVGTAEIRGQPCYVFRRT